MKFNLKPLLSLLILAMLSTTGFSQTTKKASVATKKVLKEEVFTVHGNCGMCERAIENTVKSLDGIEVADWNKETDQMTVSFDNKLVTFDNIKQKLADIGYDTDTHRAKDATYNQLPMCCQYERPKSKKKSKNKNKQKSKNKNKNKNKNKSK